MIRILNREAEITEGVDPPEGVQGFSSAGVLKRGPESRDG